jgi:manganese/zinc/iron transport system substrate-binding protein
MLRLSLFSIFSALILLLSSCGNPSSEGNDESLESAESKKLVVATTSIVADLITQITPKSIEVKGLMGPGTDPHLYKPTFGDYEAIEASDYMILSGMHLEGKMAEIMLGLKEEKNVYELTSTFTEEDKIRSNDFIDGHDPHYWMDVNLWKKSAEGSRKELKEWFPNDADSIDWYANRYIAQLEELNTQLLSWSEEIPENTRIIITSHDALNYYARAYRFEVRSLQGFSTAAEFGLKDVSDLVDFIIEKKIPAVFVENIVSSQALNAVLEGCYSKGWNVQIGGSLYTDALGETGSGADSYIGMITHNAQTMKRALSTNE